eukprot:7545089-Alexandrium_andersonii.AAC.1
MAYLEQGVNEEARRVGRGVATATRTPQEFTQGCEAAAGCRSERTNCPRKPNANHPVGHSAR